MDLLQSLTGTGIAVHDTRFHNFLCCFLVDIMINQEIYNSLSYLAHGPFSKKTSLNLVLDRTESEEFVDLGRDVQVCSLCQLLCDIKSPGNPHAVEADQSPVFVEDHKRGLLSMASRASRGVYWSLDPDSFRWFGMTYFSTSKHTRTIVFDTSCDV